MTVQQIKELLVKKATIFKTGGIRPTNELLESWIGAVKWRKQNEELPKDKDGNDMEPWATLFFEGIETAPECMNGISLCTVFISKNVLDHLVDLEGYFIIKTYSDLNKVEAVSWENEWIKSFPLIPSQVEDYPVWDGG